MADALNAVAAAPGVSQLVNMAFMSSHHGLLVDPNTELQSATMSFQQVGPRFTTHDLFAQSPDYAITGDGWFDMDKNMDMSGDIRLALGLQVAIPVTVTGQLPGGVDIARRADAGGARGDGCDQHARQHHPRRSERRRLSRRLAVGGVVDTVDTESDSNALKKFLP